MIVKWCIVREVSMEMQTPCLDNPAVLVRVDFATKLKHGTNPRMIRSVVQSQGMEIGNVIWIERITRVELNGYWAKFERLILKEGEQSLKSVQYS